MIACGLGQFDVFKVAAGEDERLALAFLKVVAPIILMPLRNIQLVPLPHTRINWSNRILAVQQLLPLKALRRRLLGAIVSLWCRCFARSSIGLSDVFTDALF